MVSCQFVTLQFTRINWQNSVIKIVICDVAETICLLFQSTLEKNVNIIIKKTIRECKDTEKKYPVAAKNILSRSIDICVILQRNFENKYKVTF